MNPKGFLGNGLRLVLPGLAPGSGDHLPGPTPLERRGLDSRLNDT
jgi:hypothetical protein